MIPLKMSFCVSLTYLVAFCVSNNDQIERKLNYLFEFELKRGELFKP